MDKFQILKLFLIVALLVIAPLLSSSLRSTYFYFIFNLLIITLGAEAGLISFFSKSPQGRKPVVVVVVPPTAPVVALEATPDKDGPPMSTLKTVNTASLERTLERRKVVVVVEKCSSMKVVGSVRARKVKKSPSTPSLFFIGGGEVDEVYEDDHEEVEEEEIGIPSKQELYHKAETFIGNFYKQLQMQREDSWKRIHGFIHKAL